MMHGWIDEWIKGGWMEERRYHLTWAHGTERNGTGDRKEPVEKEISSRYMKIADIPLHTTRMGLLKCC